jgi:hypothetical protein
MAGGSKRKGRSAKSKDFAQKQSINAGLDHRGRGRGRGGPAGESGQGTQERGPIGQFTGAGEPGMWRGKR